MRSEVSTKHGENFLDLYAPTHTRAKRKDRREKVKIDGINMQ